MNKQGNKKRKTMLGVSAGLAIAIAAGSTFAWFTSKDEVTNRLSASADYSVAIGENFQPPENWVPGQEINKDVSAVNTGNVDAFARMWLTGSMRVLKQNDIDKDIAYYNGPDAFDNVAAGSDKYFVTDTRLRSAGLTIKDDADVYYKILSTSQTINPKTTQPGAQEGFPDNTSKAYSEVQAMQASVLAYAPNNAEYTYILNEETELPIRVEVDGKTAVYQMMMVPKGTLVHVGASSVTAATYETTTGKLSITAEEKAQNAAGIEGATKYKTVYMEAQAHNDSNTFFSPCSIEFETFTPLTDGLYLFIRNEEFDDEEIIAPEFSGYFRLAGQTVENVETGDDSTETLYYALNTNTNRNNKSDYTVKGTDNSNNSTTMETPIVVVYDANNTSILHVVPSQYLTLYTAQYDSIDSTRLKFFADDVNAFNQNIYAIYDANDDNVFDEDSDIAVVITTTNIKTDAQGWTNIGATPLLGANQFTLVDDPTTPVKIANDASTLTYYYNDDIEAGDSSVNLVDSVKLYEGVTNNAYLAFDFDLNVNLESIQVTSDEDGKESADAVSSGWAATGTANIAATGTANGMDGNEITLMEWS